MRGREGYDWICVREGVKRKGKRHVWFKAIQKKNNNNNKTKNKNPTHK